MTTDGRDSPPGRIGLLAACLFACLFVAGLPREARGEAKDLKAFFSTVDSQTLQREYRLLEDANDLLQRRFFVKATELLELCVIIEPDNPHGWYRLGQAYQARGLLAKAQKAYRKTLEIDPGYPPFSREIAYPSSEGRRPLWDPVKPARIETIDRTGHERLGPGTKAGATRPLPEGSVPTTAGPLHGPSSSAERTTADGDPLSGDLPPAGASASPEGPLYFPPPPPGS
ncbi:tetratricopeptide repeat protein [Aminithiophilus ramosus]|uniref:Tetratricopeptide repeat protein n=2 Tax=Synergistales TaxID=649776 RepID=A0A9Q7EVW0_9BACT|nr:tetratricopeptide repeat protein [Aminithiophilus ramosus]QTX32783.1 tetratricopeptide repeat protein [Aminithiophilus ramosus]QVL36658.1 tetratricopeptide repeat protein [Synergistota bacterium]